MKKIMTISLIMIFLCGCSGVTSSAGSESNETPTAYIQEAEQLRLDADNSEAPVSFAVQVGRWFPYMHYSEYMCGKSEEEFRRNVSELYSSAAADGVNTVYLHAHPCGDAYYRSELFPKGACLDGDYDALGIMIEEAHKLGLSAHVWINPLRLQTAEQMEKVPDGYITKKWAEDTECPFVKLVGERWYLNPAYQEVTDLISDCVREILQNYDCDGIHIDDYFYPTTDESFDSEAFAASGSSDLAEWRQGNCTRFVKAIYDTVKSFDSRLLFGISPQGNISANYTSQYADVRLWASSGDCCDYIVPQIYFGFKNESCPFEKTLHDWEELRGESKVSLIIGLAGYKLGQSDKWAGACGENEWIENPDIISQQTELVKASSADGYAVYY